MFSFVRSCHTDYFQSGYFISHFSFLLSVKKSSCCSVSLLAFGVVSFRILAILIGCNGISFSNSLGCWVPFHMINYDLYIFLGEVSIFTHFKVGFFVFLLLNFKCSVYIFEYCIRSEFWKYFLPFCDLSFHSFNSVFHRAGGPAQIFFFHGICFWWHFQNLITKYDNHAGFLLCYFLVVL